jgi:hypothetical protein
MGIPHITDRMRSAPVQALRSVFTGIGRILLAADRPPERTASEARQAAAGSQIGERGRPDQQAPGPAGAAESRFRSLDRTGNVRLLSPGDPAERSPRRQQPARPASPPSQEPASPDAASPDAAIQAIPEAAIRAAPEAVTPAAPEPAAPANPAARPELPLASYDTLSLASIRARLRGLDADQLRVLIGYERSHAERPEVLGMLERRIEKLEAGG